MKQLLGLLMLFSVTLMCSCGDPEHVDPAAERTVLIYIAGDNNLSSNAFADLAEIVAGAKTADITTNNLLVYFHSRNSAPILYRINRNGKTVVKNYPEDQNSATADVLREVIADVQMLFPAPSNGLILWSHGTGWLPAGIYNTRTRSMLSGYMPGYDPSTIFTKSFGSQDSKEIEINDLANALPDNFYDFIHFDACLMATVEVAYALRNKCDYLTASSAEVWADGLPYDEIIGDLFTAEPELKSLCKKFYEDYQTRSGVEKTATISLIKTSELDNLADITRQIVTTYSDTIKKFNVSNLQFFDTRNRHFQYDMLDFINHVTASDPIMNRQFRTVFDKCILENYSTERILNMIPVNIHSGLCCYIPLDSDVGLRMLYQDTAWGKAAMSALYIKP